MVLFVDTGVVIGVASEVREPPTNFFIDLITSGGSIQDQFSLPPVGAILQENWQNWEQTVISVKPPITKNTSAFQTPRVSTKETTVGARNKIIGKQKSNRIGTTRETSILQQNVSGTKIRGSVAPDNRFVSFEQISPYPQFSYGNSRVHSVGNPTSRLDNFNLSDAYLHILIHRDHRKYLTFAHKNQIWQFRALAFGLSPAPWIFTQVVEEVTKMAQNRSLIMHQYLDDWLLRSQSRELLVEQTQWLLGLCEYLGLQVIFFFFFFFFFFTKFALSQISIVEGLLSYYFRFG